MCFAFEVVRSVVSCNLFPLGVLPVGVSGLAAETLEDVLAMACGCGGRSHRIAGKDKGESRTPANATASNVSLFSFIFFAETYLFNVQTYLE